MTGRLTRRDLLLATAGLGGALMPTYAAVLPSPASLQDELAQALGKRQPLVVMVSLEGCPFCKVARDHYLVPLREQEGLPVVQIDMRTSRSLRDFKGQPMTHDAISRAWRIRVAPTVLFFGRGGAEVAERLTGAYIPDFYGSYLEDRLQQARATLR